MAITVLDAGGFNYGLSNAFTVQSGTNRMAIAVVTFESVSAVTMTCTLGGVSLTDYGTLASAVNDGLKEMRARVFIADEATLATIGTGSKTLLFDISGGTGEGYQCSLLQVEGVSQSTPAAMVTTWSESASTLSVDVSVTTTGAMLVGVSSNNQASIAPTPGSGFAAVYAGYNSSGDNSGLVEYKLDASAGTESVSMTTGGSTATRCSLGGFVVEPYSVGAATAKSISLYYRTLGVT